MNILVTGASGFIGKNLLPLLVENGHSVTAVIRKSNKTLPDQIKKCQLDMGLTGWCDYLPDGIEVIVHLAQSEHYRSFPEKSDDIFGINVRATFELLEWGRKNNIKKLVMASTANVYAPRKSLLKEDDPCLPQSFYAASKLAAENMARQYCSFFDITILRIFTVYGPGQTDALIPNMIHRVLNRQKVSLAAGVGLYLTPIFVNDAVKVIDFCIGQEKNLDVVNVAGRETLTLKRILQIIGDLADIPPIFGDTIDKPTYLCGESRHLDDSIDIASGLKLTYSNLSS